MGKRQRRITRLGVGHARVVVVRGAVRVDDGWFTIRAVEATTRISVLDRAVEEGPLRRHDYLAFWLLKTLVDHPAVLRDGFGCASATHPAMGLNAVLIRDGYAL
jgi:hypothetical protein